MGRNGPAENHVVVALIFDSLRRRDLVDHYIVERGLPPCAKNQGLAKYVEGPLLHAATSARTRWWRTSGGGRPRQERYAQLVPPVLPSGSLSIPSAAALHCLSDNLRMRPTLAQLYVCVDAVAQAVSAHSCQEAAHRPRRPSVDLDIVPQRQRHVATDDL